MTILLLAGVIGLRFSVALCAPVIQQSVAQPDDPAVIAYVEFVTGKQLKAPADRKFIIAALDRLASAVEGLALRKIGPEAPVLSAARRVRHDIRQLQPFAADTPERMKNRWKVFVAAGRLIEDLSRELRAPGSGSALREAVVRAADSIDYDDPARWQPDAVEMFFNLSARALREMDVR